MISNYMIFDTINCDVVEYKRRIGFILLSISQICNVNLRIINTSRFSAAFLLAILAIILPLGSLNGQNIEASKLWTTIEDIHQGKQTTCDPMIPYSIDSTQYTNEIYEDISCLESIARGTIQNTENSVTGIFKLYANTEVNSIPDNQNVLPPDPRNPLLTKIPPNVDPGTWSTWVLDQEIDFLKRLSFEIYAGTSIIPGGYICDGLKLSEIYYDIISIGMTLYFNFTRCISIYIGMGYYNSNARDTTANPEWSNLAEGTKIYIRGISYVIIPFGIKITIPLSGKLIPFAFTNVEVPKGFTIISKFRASASPDARYTEENYGFKIEGQQYFSEIVDGRRGYGCLAIALGIGYRLSWLSCEFQCVLDDIGGFKPSYQWKQILAPTVTQVNPDRIWLLSFEFMISVHFF